MDETAEEDFTEIKKKKKKSLQIPLVFRQSQDVIREGCKQYKLCVLDRHGCVSRMKNENSQER